jgi:hypothetical protein
MEYRHVYKIKEGTSATPAPMALPGAVPFSSLAPTPAFGGLFGSSTGGDAPALAFGEFGAAPGAAGVFGGFDGSGAITSAAAPAFGGFGAASLASMALFLFSRDATPEVIPAAVPAAPAPPVAVKSS